MATKKTERTIITTIAEDHSGVTFEVAGQGKVEVLLANMATEARVYASLFGLQRKVVNAAALDAGATPAEKFAAIKAMAESLNSGGEWNRGREGGASRIDLVILGIMRHYGNTQEQADATVDKYAAKKGITRKESLKLWGSTEQVAKAIVDIKAERAAAAAKGADVDADAMMDELDD